MMPIKIPMSCTSLVFSLSQRVAIINENSGVVPFRTDIVPAFKFRAACEKRKKGIEALIQAKSIRGRKSFLRFLDCRNEQRRESVSMMLLAIERIPMLLARLQGLQPL